MEPLGINFDTYKSVITVAFFLAYALYLVERIRKRKALERFNLLAQVHFNLAQHHSQLLARWETEVSLNKEILDTSKDIYEKFKQRMH